MKWTHIMDARPDNKTIIMQCDPPYHNFWTGELLEADFSTHYTIGMRRYTDTPESWSYYMKQCEKKEWQYPDYWWIYAKDFPFPTTKPIMPKEELNE